VSGLVDASPRLFCHAGREMVSAIGEEWRSSNHESTKEHENTKAPTGLKVLRFEQLSSKVIGAALAVHRELGPGFLESVYHSAMRVSLAHRAISFESQLPVDITFEGVPVGGARIDLVIARQIVLELKSVDRLHDIHFVQLRSYLRAAHLHLGLLLNFNSPTLTIRRVIVD
jgi:GxxExxY protein